MPAPQPWPPEYPEPEPDPDFALSACPLGDAETCPVTSFRAFGRDDSPSEPYHGGSRRRRFGLDDDEDGDGGARFDRWREG